MKLLITCALLGLLAACVNPQVEEARRLEIEIADHKECSKLGFKTGTDAYGDCRLRLKEMRIMQLGVNNARFGVGYYGPGAYYSHGRPWMGHPW